MVWRPRADHGRKHEAGDAVLTRRGLTPKGPIRKHYQDTIETLLARNIGIEKYFSYVVIKTVFTKKHYPLEKFFAEQD